MFFHNFKYSLKALLKNKSLVFWTLAFPLILGTFFYMAFSDIESSEAFKSENIAIVNTEEFNNNVILKETFKELSSDTNKGKIFNIKYVDINEANKLLEEDKIVGILNYTDEANIIIKKNGTEQTIFKNVVDTVINNYKTIDNISKIEIEKSIANGNYDYENIYNEVINNINETKSNIKNISKNNLSYTMIEYYTLIAMSAMYGGILAMYVINNLLANMSSKGKRISISPCKKIYLVFSSLLASYFVQVVGLLILFLYTIFVLNVSYGSNLLLVIILALSGSLAGLSLGTLVSCLVKSNDNIKTSIILSITMLGSYLSGMMGITMKYVVDKNIPIINKINPVSMITDGLYSLYYYDTLDRYYFNLISLLIFSCLLLFISTIVLRRQKYDSI